MKTPTRTTPAIQCARRVFHSYLNERVKKINNQFLSIQKRKIFFVCTQGQVTTKWIVQVGQITSRN